MGSPPNPVTLAHWRRTVAELYAEVRATAQGDPAGAARRFRVARDRLFREHVQSPIAEEARAGWRGFAWYDYDPSWRVDGDFETSGARTEFAVELAADGLLRCARAGQVRFAVRGHAATLALYWIEGYGGGLWLPFLDATSGSETYGGGRYLYDTIKGADLGGDGERIVLDFNFAYNPSCAYDARWSCPLAPAENRLPFAVTAGERITA